MAAAPLIEILFRARQITAVRNSRIEQCIGDGLHVYLIEGESGNRQGTGVARPDSRLAESPDTRGRSSPSTCAAHCRKRFLEAELFGIVGAHGDWRASATAVRKAKFVACALSGTLLSRPERGRFCPPASGPSKSCWRAFSGLAARRCRGRLTPVVSDPRIIVASNQPLCRARGAFGALSSRSVFTGCNGVEVQVCRRCAQGASDIVGHWRANFPGVGGGGVTGVVRPCCCFEGSGRCRSSSTTGRALCGSSSVSSSVACVALAGSGLLDAR
jgi:hypothetical protein